MPNIVKNTTILSPLDLLAPHSCRGCSHIGEPLCHRCKNYIISSHQNLCPICHTPNSDGKCQDCQGLPPIFIVGPRASLIGELVHDFKYNSVRSLARPLAEILSATLPPAEQLTIQQPSASPSVVIVPLPTISRHIRERGFSHTHLIARHFAKLRPNCSATSLLTRAKSTVQVGASRSARLTQASEAYALAPKAKIDPTATYILFDDVWTTGASIQAATKILQDAGAKNIIITILALSGASPD